MYKRDLDQLLMRKALPSSILLYGDSPYELHLYKERIANTLGAKEDRLVMYHDEYDFKVAKDYLSQTSLFGGENVLVIVHDKALAKKEIETLVSFANKSEENALIYVFSGEDKSAKTFSKYFSKKNAGDVVRFFKPNLRESIAMLFQNAQAIGLDIQQYALEHLLHVHNADVGLCIKELEKLNILQKKIEIKDIDALVYGLNAISLEEFMNKLFGKMDVKNDLVHILEAGVADEMRIMMSLGTFMQKVFSFHAYIKIHGNSNPKEILGFIPPRHVVENYEKIAVGLKMVQFEAIFTHFMEVEYNLKTSQNMDKSAYLYHALIKLQRIIG